MADNRQWEIRFSNTRKRPYFYCATNSESVWEAPPALTPEQISQLPGAHHLAYEPASKTTYAPIPVPANGATAPGATPATAGSAPAAAASQPPAQAAAAASAAPPAPPTKVRASHLLIKSEKSRRPSSWRQAKITRSIEEAKLILQAHESNLKAAQNINEAFAKLARTESDCSSAKEGGDLGFFGRQQMQKPFENAAFALNVGQMSPITQTDSGLHLILRTG